MWRYYIIAWDRSTLARLGPFSKIPSARISLGGTSSSMLEAAGAEISEGAGSRVRIALNDVRAVFHRPHPKKETDKGAVKSMRRFLSEAGVTP